MKVLKNLQKKSKRNPKKLASTTSSQMANRVYYFGSFCLKQAEQQLLRNGEPIRLAPKTFDVLLVLIQNKGCLVTKEKLLEEVWPDAFVEEANLSVNIANLRKALDEGLAQRQCIETVPKRGYRFVAPVSELGFESVQLLEKSHFSEAETGGERNQLPHSLAVLLFENEGCGSDAEYLSAGLTESIINSLSQSHDFRVMARNTVYLHQGKDKNPRTVGHELGVRLVLAGRILQLGDRLIIRTELVDVINGWQLWGEQYHTKLADVLVIQQEIAEEISERLRIKLTVDEKQLAGGDDINSNHVSEAVGYRSLDRTYWT